MQHLVLNKSCLCFTAEALGDVFVSSFGFPLSFYLKLLKFYKLGGGNFYVFLYQLDNEDVWNCWLAVESHDMAIWRAPACLEQIYTKTAVKTFTLSNQTHW